MYISIDKWTYIERKIFQMYKNCWVSWKKLFGLFIWALLQKSPVCARHLCKRDLTV